jgi:hypothetical protein
MPPRPPTSRIAIHAMAAAPTASAIEPITHQTMPPASAPPTVAPPSLPKIDLSTPPTAGSTTSARIRIVPQSSPPAPPRFCDARFSGGGQLALLDDADDAVGGRFDARGVAAVAEFRRDVLGDDALRDRVGDQPSRP